MDHLATLQSIHQLLSLSCNQWLSPPTANLVKGTGLYHFPISPKGVINTRHNPFWQVAGWFVIILRFWRFWRFLLFWGLFFCVFWHKLLPKAHFLCFQRGCGVGG